MMNTNFTQIIHKKQHDQLLQSLEKCITNNQFQIELISGESGTGKSSMCAIFQSNVETNYPEVHIASTFCSLHSEFCLPYAPFRNLLEAILLPCQNDNRKLTKSKLLKLILRKSIESAPELISSFIPAGNLISKIGKELIDELGLLDKIGKNKPLNTTEPDSIDERKILSQYAEILRINSEEQPLVLILDDFQWVDKASTNMLYYLMRTLNDCPIYLLISYRSSEITSSHNGEPHVLLPVLFEIKRYFGDVMIDLDAIPEIEKLEILNQLLDTKENNFDQKFRSALFQITDGNPLFVLEMLESLKQSQEIIQKEGIWTIANEINWHQKPAKIEGIIQERISKLESSSIDLLSHASVQGNHFIAQILSRTLNESEREVLASLTRKLQKEHRLVREINCFRSGKNLISQFQFSNFIFQHYLYEELSYSQRMLLHGDVAEMMEEMFADRLDDFAAEIAQHFELSGELIKSLSYYHRAADHAFHISCFNEALKSYEKCLALIEEISNDSSRENQLDIIINYSICLRNTLGYNHPDVEHFYLLAKKLAEELNKPEKTATILFGLWSVYLMKLELNKAEDFAIKFLQQGKELDNQKMINNAIISLANTYFWQGKFECVMNTLNEFKTPVDLNSESIALHKFLEILSVQKLNTPDKNQKISELTAFIPQMINPFSQAISYQTLAWFYFFEGNYELMKLNALQLIKISEENNFTNYLGLGYMFHGRAIAEFDDPEKGIRLVENGYNNYIIVNGGKIMNSIYMLLSTEILLKQKKYELILNRLESSLEFSKNSGEIAYFPELLYYESMVAEILGDQLSATRYQDQADASCLTNHSVNLRKGGHLIA